MRRWTNLLFPAFAVGALILALSREADAYIDPGTGSLVLQMIVAGVVGAGFAIRIFWKHIRTFFFGLFSKKSGRGPDEGPA